MFSPAAVSCHPGPSQPVAHPRRLRQPCPPGLGVVRVQVLQVLGVEPGGDDELAAGAAAAAAAAAAGTASFLGGKSGFSFFFKKNHFSSLKSTILHSYNREQ